MKRSLLSWKFGKDSEGFDRGYWKKEAGKRGVRRGYDQVKSDFYCEFESLCLVKIKEEKCEKLRGMVIRSIIEVNIEINSC